MKDKQKTFKKDEKNPFKQIGKFASTIMENLPKMDSEKIQYWIEHPFETKKILEKFADISKAAKENALRILSHLSLSERIKRGKYDWVNSDINEKNFPETVSADYESEYKLFHFNRSISSEDAIKEMEKEGYRPGNISELLALGEVKPELQREFPIVELGLLWLNPFGGRSVAVLRCDGDRRELGLDWFGCDWSARFRFLGVRK